jgi:transposase-like protein
LENPCKYCKNPKVIKYGCRSTKQRGKIRIFQCKKCLRTFCEDDGFKHKHYPKDKVIDTVQTYLDGLSSRDIAESKELSKNTVLKWVLEFADKLDQYIQKFKQNITTHLHMDELFLKMLNTFYYVWDSICRDTRLITIVFAPRRTAKYANELLDKSPKPLEITTDGAWQYKTLVRKRYGTWWYYHNYHLCQEFEDKKNNNIIERVQNFIRSKIHQRRGYKDLETGRKHLRLLEIYYNFVRIHSAIKMTPAEKAGLIEYNNLRTKREKWIFLMRNAAGYFLIIFYQS